MEQLDNIMEQLRQPMIDTLKRWIQVPSVKAGAETGAPFGKTVLKALETALSDCEKMGLKTQNFDGYIGHADLGEGSDQDALAILSHLDVVPEGDGWKHEPFGAQIENGRMYGRGTSDDKGPAVAALFAMRAVQLAGIPLKRKVRLILGCDEESGWDDIKHYTQAAVMPDMGFSPDANYPVINIEKGICHLSLRSRLNNSGPGILEFCTGERPNVVPGRAVARVAGGAEIVELVKAVAEEKGFPVSAVQEEGSVRITATGIPGHAAFPSIARNAIGQMLITLKAIGVTGALSVLCDAVGVEYDGKSLGIKVEDDMSGPLTCNIGILRTDADRLYATLDIRYPVLANPEEMIKTLRAHLPGIEVTADSIREPHHVPESSELVQQLLNAYHEVTGREKKAVAIGGGTYARSLKEGVAFGSTFPDEEDLAHQADEYMDLNTLYLNLRIFTNAIIKLAGA